MHLCDSAACGAFVSHILFRFQKTLTFVSNRAGIKLLMMAAQTLGTPGIGSQTHLVLAKFDTNVSVF